MMTVSLPVKTQCTFLPDTSKEASPFACPLVWPFDPLEAVMLRLLDYRVFDEENS